MTIYLPNIECEEHEHTSNPKLADWWRWSKIYPSKTNTSEDQPNFQEERFENWVALSEIEAEVDQEQCAGISYLCVIAPHVAAFVIPDNVDVSGAVVVSSNIMVSGGFNVDVSGAIVVSNNSMTGGGYTVRNQYPSVYVVSQPVGIPIVLAPSWDNRLERAAVKIGLYGLQVPYEIDKQVLPLLSGATLKAASIVTSILDKKISSGMPANHIRVESLVDYDAGEWTEIVFTIHVNLNSKEANREWDDVLATVSEATKRLADQEVASSLLERIGIHFTWEVPPQHV